MGARKVRPKIIYVEANIGVGKSTVVRKLKGKFSAVILEEPVHEWIDFEGVNMLEGVSKNPAEWALAFQTLAAVTVTEATRAHGDQTIIQERSLHSILNLFGKTLADNGHLKPHEFKILKRLVDTILGLMNRDEYFIYLRLEPEEAYRRMILRGRTEEDALPLSYFQQLHDAMEDWMQSQAKVFIIDAMQPPDVVFKQVEQAISNIMQK